MFTDGNHFKYHLSLQDSLIKLNTPAMPHTEQNPGLYSSPLTERTTNVFSLPFHPQNVLLQEKNLALKVAFKQCGAQKNTEAFRVPRADRCLRDCGMHSAATRESALDLLSTKRVLFVLPLRRHLMAAAMLTVPDCADEIDPGFQLHRNVKKVPLGSWQRGKVLVGAEEQGGDEQA